MQVPMFQPQSFCFIRSVRGSSHLCCKEQSCDLMQGIPGTILGKYCFVSTMGHAVSFAISFNLINKLRGSTWKDQAEDFKSMWICPYYVSNHCLACSQVCIEQRETCQVLGIGSHINLCLPILGLLELWCLPDAQERLPTDLEAQSRVHGHMTWAGPQVSALRRACAWNFQYIFLKGSHILFGMEPQ